VSDVAAPETGTEVAAGPADPLRTAIVATLERELGDSVVAHYIDAGRDAWVRVATDRWADAGRVARDALGMSFFSFLSVIDWLPSPFGRSMDSEVDNELAPPAAKDPEPMTWGYTGGETRFQCFARLYSVADRVGVILKADIPDDTLTIGSWTSLFGGANWHEREAWEMFGVNFAGHPGLRKLYLPGDFEGFPLRKDYPLLARIVKPWPGIVDVEGIPGEPVGAGDGGGEE
jgi:NADH-quinone oxidoreductase subunit C